MQHLQKTGGRGVLWLTSFLLSQRSDVPTFQRACKRPLFSIASTLFHFRYPLTPLFATLTKTTGCVPTISILKLNALRFTSTSVSTFRRVDVQTFRRLAIPLSQTEQPCPPSPMHIMSGLSPLLRVRGIALSRCLGGRHEGQAPHRPYRRRRFDRPGSRHAVLDSR